MTEMIFDRLQQACTDMSMAGKLYLRNNHATKQSNKNVLCECVYSRTASFHKQHGSVKIKPGVQE